MGTNKDSVSVSFSADDVSLNSTLVEMAQAADETGAKIQEAFKETSSVVDEQLRDIKTHVDDLKTSDFTIGGHVDDADAKAKLDDMDARIERMKRAGFVITGHVDDAAAKLKLDDFKAKVDEVRHDDPTVTVHVDDRLANAKLDTFEAKAHMIGSNNTTYNIRLSGGGAGSSKPDSSAVKDAAKALKDDLGDAVLEGMKTVSIAAAIMPAADVAAGTVGGFLASALTVAFSGGAFALALTGSKNPVALKFKKEVEGILTTFDKAMAPYTAPALTALLSPLSAWLTDVAPDVKGFAQGLEEIAKALDSSLKSQGVQKLFQEIGTDTASEMSQMAPIIGDVLAGTGQLLVAAKPVVDAMMGLFGSGAAAFAGKGATADETKFFQGLASDMTKYGPEIHQIFSNFGTDVGLFLQDIKPLEGPTLKVVDDAVASLGDVLKGLAPVIDVIASALGEIEKLPGGNTAVGMAALVLATKSIRGVFADIVKLAAQAKSLGSLGGALKGALGGNNAAASKLSAAGTSLQEAAAALKEAAGAEDTSATMLDASAGGSGLGGLVMKWGPKIALFGTAVAAFEIGTHEWADVVGGLKKVNPKEHGTSSYGKTGAGITNPKVQSEAPADLGLMLQAYGDILAGKNIPAALLKKIGASGMGGPSDVMSLASLRKMSPTDRDETVLGDLMGLKATAKLSPAQQKAVDDLGKQVLAGLEESLKGTNPQSAMDKQAEAIIAKAKKAFGIKSPSTVFAGIGVNLLEGLDKGLTNSGQITQLDRDIDLITKAIETKLKAFVPEMVLLGKDFDTGLAKGITDNTTLIGKAASDAALSGLDAAKVATGTHSPSVEFAKLGAANMQGWALGINSSSDMVRKSLDNVASYRPASAPVGAAQSGGSGTSVVINLNIQTLDGRLAPNVIDQIKTVVHDAVAETHDAGIGVVRVMGPVR